MIVKLSFGFQYSCLLIYYLVKYINRTEAVTFCRNLHKAEKEEIKSMDGAMLSQTNYFFILKGLCLFYIHSLAYPQSQNPISMCIPRDVIIKKPPLLEIAMKYLHGCREGGICPPPGFWKSMYFNHFPPLSQGQVRAEC